MKYTLQLKVEGDRIKPTYVSVMNYEAESLKDLAEQAWGQYKLALRYVLKEMESAVLFEHRPNSLFSLRCTEDGQDINEETVLKEFFKRRTALFLNNNIWYTPKDKQDV